ncbi:MAG: hypothetical protein V1659_01640 [Candidatus Woesearchaeota archaeon]
MAAINFGKGMAINFEGVLRPLGSVPRYEQKEWIIDVAGAESPLPEHVSRDYFPLSEQDPRKQPRIIELKDTAGRCLDALLVPLRLCCFACELEHALKLVFDPGRRMWLAVHYSKRIDDGRVVCEEYTGPHVLDDECLGRILVAAGLLDDSLLYEPARWTSFDDFRRLLQPQ